MRENNVKVNENPFIERNSKESYWQCPNVLYISEVYMALFMKYLVIFHSLKYLSKIIFLVVSFSKYVHCCIRGVVVQEL